MSSVTCLADSQPTGPGSRLARASPSTAKAPCSLLFDSEYVRAKTQGLWRASRIELITNKTPGRLLFCGVTSILALPALIFVGLSLSVILMLLGFGDTTIC